MHTRIIAGALLLSLAFLLPGCGGSDWTPVKDGATLELAIDETKMVSLDTVGGVPYLWEREGFDPQIVLVGDPQYHSKKDAPKAGDPLKAVFGLRGLKAGETQVTFVYRHYGDQTVDKTRTLTVIVR
jgi:predicted secreted protein